MTQHLKQLENNHITVLHNFSACSNMFLNVILCLIVFARYPEQEQLQMIYATYLKPILHRQLSRHPIWGNNSRVNALAGTMVAVYDQLRQRFTVDDYSHYLFTPRDLTNWALGLLRYDLTAATNDSTSDHVLEVWAYEAQRLFRDRLVGTDSVNKFDNALISTIRSDWSANVYDGLQSEYIKFTSLDLCLGNFQ